MKKDDYSHLLNQLIEITEKNVSDKAQPLVTVGARFIVKNIIEPFNRHPLVLEVKHPKRKKATLRVSAKRFKWRIITPEVLHEEALKRECKESAKHLVEDFTEAEQVQIAFVPLIFNHIAWHYAMKAVGKAAEYHVELLKKITREVRSLKGEYQNEVKRDLDYKHIQRLEAGADKFIERFAKDFTIMYFSVNREFKSKMPTYPFDDLRTYAIMSMLFIKYVDEHNKRMDALIASRLGNSKESIRMPIMDRLYTYMEAMAGDAGKFNYDNADIKLCMKIFQNNASKIEFDITKDK